MIVGWIFFKTGETNGYHTIYCHFGLDHPALHESLDALSIASKMNMHIQSKVVATLALMSVAHSPRVWQWIAVVAVEAFVYMSDCFMTAELMFRDVCQFCQ
jgi:hypothetical protein